MEKISLEQLEEMQKDLLKKQCDLDIQKAFVKHFIKKKQSEQLIITDVVERLPIGTVVKLIDSEDFKGFLGELKITGYCSYMGEPKGYLVNGEGIFLDEDFVR